MAFHYTNRRGSTYHLHRRKTKTGRVTYVFAKSVGDGALDALPEGYRRLADETETGRTLPPIPYLDDFDDVPF